MNNSFDQNGNEIYRANIVFIKS